MIKFSLFVATILALSLTACSDPKPGQYPLSQNVLEDRDVANQD